MKHDVSEHGGHDERARLAQRQARLRTALRLRGLVKLTVITIAVAHLLTIAFQHLLAAAGFAPDAATLLLFRFVSCALVSYWLQADALRAYRHASEHGFVTLPGANGDAVSIAAQCPRRWLVVLNLQLDPRWLAEERMK
ncbi:hypothetical protein ACV229_06920 [Burkholderia sp. MR1-5-21]